MEAYEVKLHAAGRKGREKGTIFVAPKYEVIVRKGI